jgi:hypothetical protein
MQKARKQTKSPKDGAEDIVAATGKTANTSSKSSAAIGAASSP